jgi:hypothetical protein
VLEAGVGRAGVDEVGRRELADAAQALERCGVDEAVDEPFVKVDVAVDGVFELS